MRRLQNTDGFTIVELMMTMIIIGIVAQIAITLYLDMTRRSNDATALADARNLITVTNVNFINLDDVDYTAVSGNEIGVNGWSDPGARNAIFILSNGVEVDSIDGQSTGMPFGDLDGSNNWVENCFEATLYHESGTSVGGVRKTYYCAIDEIVGASMPQQ